MGGFPMTPPMTMPWQVESFEATDVQLTGGSNPTVTDSRPAAAEKECGRLSPAPELHEGRLVLGSDDVTRPGGVELLVERHR